MLLQQFFDAGLGHASYLVADPDAGVAFLVDPDRAVDAYLAAASKLDVLVTHSFETHVHNDYLSGSRALAELRPIAVVTGAEAKLAYPHTALRDGESIDVGALRVRCVATPGHTPEHVAYLVSDLRRAEDPQYLFSGGALLVGHIARVDLLGPELEERLARDAYATLREKVLSLADYVAVFPTHGGGSACTATVAGSRWTTLGFERRHNDVARAAGAPFEEFRDTIAAGLPVAPAYYPKVRALNHRGASLPDRRPLPLLSDPLPKDAALLDPRPPHLYGGAHRRGALNIVGNDGFAVRCGAVVPFGTPLVLLTRDEEQAERLRAQLSLIGFDDVRGYADPVGAADDTTATTQQVDARTAGRLADDGAVFLDVRERSEFVEGHVPGARHIPYQQLDQRMDEVPRERTLVVYCASGVRSSLANSILERHGRVASNMRGGFTAWRNAGLPTET
ncbi:MAG TPA: MBL fold metallo-hydrolase [Candidatus Limnocylindria bacterium]|jgi:hydroxyacylglutathione hydrolase|nr:MBL fold metallo-hydrolase [Candidatus Limnocylindria bacterium]